VGDGEEHRIMGSMRGRFPAPDPRRLWRLQRARPGLHAEVLLLVQPAAARPCASARPCTLQIICTC
jgi:hypothetical protein